MGFGGGPTYVFSLWLIDHLFDLIAMRDLFYSALWHALNYSSIVH